MGATYPLRLSTVSAGPLLPPSGERMTVHVASDGSAACPSAVTRNQNAGPSMLMAALKLPAVVYWFAANAATGVAHEAASESSARRWRRMARSSTTGSVAS